MSLIRSVLSISLYIGDTKFDVVSFSSDTEMNVIPSADVVLAIGRDAVTGTAAAVHRALNKITPDATAKVYFCPTGQWSDAREWPAGPHLCFEGRVANLGYRKVNGKVHVIVKLRHWIGDMDNSSCVSSQSHPANPQEFTFQSITGSLNRTGIVMPAGIAMTSEARSINLPNVREDLWGKALKPLFCALAKQKRVRLNPELKTCFGEEEQNNGQALAALSRIEGVSGDSECDLALSCYTPKVSMIADVGSVQDTVGDAISRAIRFESINGFVHTTMWGKLIGYTSVFGFSVIPLVERALVVPFVPGLRRTYCKTIQNCDYNYIDFNNEIKQSLLGVGITVGRTSETGLVATAGRNISSQIGIGACYSPEGAETGMFKFVKGPLWLEMIPVSAHSAKRSLGMGKRTKFSTATTPQTESNPELIANKDGAKRGDIIREISSLYDDYAHYMYMLDTLRGRYGMVSGKLRFDIAPGSSILIAGSAERFLAGEDALAQNVIGTVRRVSIGINAENGQAGTSFLVGHVRTEKENENERFSVENHPLYTDTFVGAPLIDALWFKEEGNNCC